MMKTDIGDLGGNNDTTRVRTHQVSMKQNGSAYLHVLLLIMNKYMQLEPSPAQ